MLRAIAAAKKKNDRIDASKIADCVRCDLYESATWLRRRSGTDRRTLRYRNLVIKQMVQMKNRVSGLLMETGVSYNKQRLHKVGYFAELMATNEEVHESIRPLLRLSRDMISRSQKLDYALVSSLERDPVLKERLRRLRTVPGVGPITALTWALEIGDYTRFSSIKQAISYCGLCGEEKSSADKVMRMPISKQRNKHIQRVLIEAAKLAPSESHELALTHARELDREIGTAPPWLLPGRWSATCSPSNADSRTLCLLRCSAASSQRKNLFPQGKRKDRDSSTRRLPGPADWRLGEGAHPEAPTDCFGTGREQQPNHL